MAGYCTGPNTRVPRDVFVLTYIEALDRGLPPGQLIQSRFGINRRRYERQRAMLSKHSWLPYGRLQASDRDRIMAGFKAKLREVQAHEMAAEDVRARRQRFREVQALKNASMQTRRSPVLDHFGL